MQGLSEKEVKSARNEFGKNVLRINETKRAFKILWDVIKEPMFLLLLVACTLYFILGENTEGIMMVVALCFVSTISIFQEIKSSNALEALKKLTEPKTKVIRNGVEKMINVEEVVPGDLILLEEGNRIPADAEILQENDLSVNEAIITGESMPVEKSNVAGSNFLFQGTVLNSGRCIAKVKATGANTTLGKIGKSIATYSQSKTQLQKYVDVFVKRLAFFGITAFFIIFLINYLRTEDAATSLLYGLTLAMSAIPEEIPVAFSSFMALGAYHMSRLGIITRQPQTIENLGAVNVICLDKTGTITENKMKVKEVYDFESNTIIGLSSITQSQQNVIFYALLASEKNPFDAMEKAIVDLGRTINLVLPEMNMIAEYALHGRPPMMTHVYEIQGLRIAAAKGAVERIIRVCHLTDNETKKILDHTKKMASKGYRVLGVSYAEAPDGNLPKEQDDFQWKFKGLMCFYDPPRPHMQEVFKQFYQAGISVKLLTGDFPETALTIADETGLKHDGKYLTGEEIMKMTGEELKTVSANSDLFVRMYPEAKLKVIQELIKDGNIVAMTGDGVNDAPALKAANIGIALGEKGTEVARQSADLVITNDDLRKLVEAVRHGRKIFENLKKAIRYIISIHIPIILTASLPLLLGWKYPNIFTPIHVIFLELIMGPTCSIFFEREPVEESIMKVSPRSKNAWLFKKDEFFMSIVQGLAITLGILILYYVFMHNGASLTKVRSLVFITLILSNIILTFSNRSFKESFFKTIHYKNDLVLPVFIISICFLAVIHMVPFVRNHFGMTVLSSQEFIICLVTALFSVGWFEVYKAVLKPSADYKHRFQ